MGNHGCAIPGRGCQAWQALEALYQQSPLAGVILGVIFVALVSVVILWLLDLRGSTSWKPEIDYEPPRMERREQEQPSRRR